MRIVFLSHSLRSCWSHGSAHFLRGVLRELAALGHDVTAYEPQEAGSLADLLGDQGCSERAGDAAAEPFLETYDPDGDLEALEALLDGSHLVVVHQWNRPELVARIGRIRARGGSFLALFHDTHHRALTAPDELTQCNLPAYDGVLAAGTSLAEAYERMGWGDRVFTWREGADTTVFQPPEEATDREGLAWIGDWADGERLVELRDFLFRPAREAGLPIDVFGVRFSDRAKRALRRAGVRCHGWLPNAKAGEVLASHLATVQIPRRLSASLLPGCPPIRMFEALACGIPLVAAPWADSEGLFRPDRDYLVARDGGEMTRHLRSLRDDEALRITLAHNGLATIRAGHSCARRAEELIAIAERLRAPALRNVA